jgi:hypothetical protein
VITFKHVRQTSRRSNRPARIVFAVCLLLTCNRTLYAQDKTLSDIELREHVKAAINDGTDFLRRAQEPNGSWIATDHLYSGHTAGLTALAVLSQISCDVPVRSKEVQAGLRHLRETQLSSLKKPVYEVSLMIMAFCAAKEFEKDMGRIRALAGRLQESQATAGSNSGLWHYKLAEPGQTITGGDRSNGQYAVLALRDAAYAGVEIDQKVWQRVKDQWGNAEQGWGYGAGSSGTNSIGSMTVAGLATVAITTRMLADDSDTDAEGKAECCTPHPPPDSLKHGINWLSTRFSTSENPGHGRQWHLYYLYGLERAGRLTGIRFFGKHDWYRSGARWLVGAQHPDGRWSVAGGYEKDPVLATSWALLFLSKGLSRIVVHKLDYTSLPQKEDPNGEWNQHHLDVPNLIDHIDSIPDWPPRLNSQVLTLSKLQDPTAVSDMNQAPVLYISGRNTPMLTDQHIAWLREYIDAGGFIYAQANCGDGTFDDGFRAIVRRMFPDGEASLERLQADHPIYRSQYLLNSDNLELNGVDFGCRTSIVYSPEDHGCYWHKWMRHPPKKRSTGLTQRVIRSMRLGVNVIAYATGREPPEKLNNATPEGEAPTAQIARGLQEIAQLQHDGGWDTAPRAVSNLLEGLNKTTGMGFSTKRRPIPITLEALTRFPLAYMHGRFGFRLTPTERNALRDYLSRGPLLVADACCGSKQFDESFRMLMRQVYPDHPLEPIPADHPMFTEETGFNVTQVRRRQLMTQSQKSSLQSQVKTGPPQMEGIQIDGQYLVIYSRFDLSCALENQASIACDGYVKDDAMKLAINLVMFALDEEVLLAPAPPPVEAENTP